MSNITLMDGKVAVVTGAGRGIGREVALSLATHGARVVVNDIGASLDGYESDTAISDEVVAEISKKGGEAIADSNSISESTGAESVVQTALDTYGRIDCVVNCAGILRDKFFHKMDYADWDAVIKVNLSGAFNICRAAAPHFRSQSSGAYVHMTSNAGLVGALGQANYAASKAGVVGLSRSISLEMERFNVRSNCVAPFAWSRMVAAIPTNTEKQKIRVERIKKKMPPSTIAPVVVFLLSDAASAVSGQIFTVRGNEVLLMSQPRPIRSAHCSDGWTPQTLAERMLPAFEASFYPLELAGDVFPWDAI